MGEIDPACLDRLDGELRCRVAVVGVGAGGAHRARNACCPKLPGPQVLADGGAALVGGADHQQAVAPPSDRFTLTLRSLHRRQAIRRRRQSLRLCHPESATPPRAGRRSPPFPAAIPPVRADPHRCEAITRRADDRSRADEPGRLRRHPQAVARDRCRLAYVCDSGGHPRCRRRARRQRACGRRVPRLGLGGGHGRTARRLPLRRQSGPGPSRARHRTCRGPRTVPGAHARRGPARSCRTRRCRCRRIMVRTDACPAARSSPPHRLRRDHRRAREVIRP